MWHEFLCDFSFSKETKNASIPLVTTLACWILYVFFLLAYANAHHAIDAAYNWFIFSTSYVHKMYCKQFWNMPIRLEVTFFFFFLGSIFHKMKNIKDEKRRKKKIKWNKVRICKWNLCRFVSYKHTCILYTEYNWKAR